jgi:hypothetical protein
MCDIDRRRRILHRLSELACHRHDGFAVFGDGETHDNIFCIHSAASDRVERRTWDSLRPSVEGSTSSGGVRAARQKKRPAWSGAVLPGRGRTRPGSARLGEP